jgi:hypothetical protein
MGSLIGACTSNRLSFNRDRDSDIDSYHNSIISKWVLLAGASGVWCQFSGVLNCRSYEQITIRDILYSVLGLLVSRW